MVHLVIEFDPKQGGGEDNVQVSIDARQRERIEEVQLELGEWGSEAQPVLTREIELDEECQDAIDALRIIMDGGRGPLWWAFEEIAKQAFLAGLSCGRAGKVPIPIAVK